MDNKEFNPSIDYPAYLTRRRLLEGIRSQADKMYDDMLDFGCGSKPYKNIFVNVKKYTGLDFENPGHSHINEQIDVFYDGKSIPFPDETFDSAFSSEVFEHVFNLEQMVPEINRVMKRGGTLLITCPFAICEHETPNDYARYSSFGIRYLLEKNGFEIIMQEKLGSSIEVMTSFFIIYLEFHVFNHLLKIPLLGKAFRFLTYSFCNLQALFFGKFMPRGKELYLNNLVVCRKK